jgi:hypothetical protein
VTCAWALLYIERWLTAPMQQEDGTIIERSRGTPQGGVVSPILANLFMHYAFDTWMTRRTPDLPWCRYADDGLVHCRSEREAQSVREALSARLAECGLELHPTKTKIVYCKDHRRKSKYETVSFDFLGFCFRPRSVKGSSQKIFCGYTPAVSTSALNAMRETIRGLKIRKRTEVTLGRHRPRTQPHPTGLDRVLRAIHAISALSSGSLPQPDAGRLVEAEIQALPPATWSSARLPCEDST